MKSVHNEIFIFDSSKMLKVKNKHFKFQKPQKAQVSERKGPSTMAFHFRVCMFWVSDSDVPIIGNNN